VLKNTRTTTTSTLTECSCYLIYFGSRDWTFLLANKELNHSRVNQHIDY